MTFAFLGDRQPYSPESAATSRPTADPAILDELTYCQDILTSLPPALKVRLLAGVTDGWGS